MDADALGGSDDRFRHDSWLPLTQMSPNQLIASPLSAGCSEVSCFDGTRAIGRIDGDGSVIGTIQFRGTGPERSAWLPAGTLKINGEAVCASLKGVPLEPCFKLNRTSDRSFRGSVLGLDFAYCDFAQVVGRRHGHARADDRSTDGPLQLRPCTARIEEQC